ncbi:hypothetical protein B0H19DRAFT_1066633 [Mycena capillaripes]|nr:hypothetical protein B0H19DRAFT_1066633 [Mycena capillaripes]
MAGKSHVVPVETGTAVRLGWTAQSKNTTAVADPVKLGVNLRMHNSLVEHHDRRSNAVVLCETSEQVTSRHIAPFVFKNNIPLWQYKGHLTQVWEKIFRRKPLSLCTIWRQQRMKEESGKRKDKGMKIHTLSIPEICLSESHIQQNRAGVHRPDQGVPDLWIGQTDQLTHLGGVVLWLVRAERQTGSKMGQPPARRGWTHTFWMADARGLFVDTTCALPLLGGGGGGVSISLADPEIGHSLGRTDWR